MSGDIIIVSESILLWTLQTLKCIFAETLHTITKQSNTLHSHNNDANFSRLFKSSARRQLFKFFYAFYLEYFLLY